MSYVCAFLIAGAWGALFEVLFIASKAKQPGLLLRLSVILGGVLSAFGISDVLTGIGGAGNLAQIVAAGSLLEAGTNLVLRGVSDGMPMLMSLLILVVGTVIVGCGVGALRVVARRRRMVDNERVHEAIAK